MKVSFIINKKVIALMLSILSLIIPWLSLAFSFKNSYIPIAFFMSGALLALAALIIAVPAYWKNKTDLAYLAASLMAFIGLFYSLPSILIIIVLSNR